MKKALILVLAMILTMALTVPVAAVGSPVAPETSDTTTAPLPEIVEIEIVAEPESGTKTDEDTIIVVEPVTAENAGKLTNDAQETFASAQETLQEEVPANMKAQYFFYVTIVQTDNNRSFVKNYDGSVSMTMKIANATQVVVKQFVDGQWVELEAIINGDGTITIKGVVEGPIAIFTK